jgi:hypothetical protein
MDNTPFYPPSGTLGAQVCAYFRGNPEESLSVADIVCKFDAERGQVVPLLAGCVTQALLTRVKVGTAYTFSAGPALPLGPVPAHNTAQVWPFATMADTPLVSPQFPAKKARPKLRGHLPALDVDKLKIDTNIKPLARMSGIGDTRYDPIFNRLTAPGQSTELPIMYQGSINKAATKYRKHNPAIKISVRKMSATACRVFRIA